MDVHHGIEAPGTVYHQGFVAAVRPARVFGRRHHRDPGATYKAYRKYYQMETKKSVFGFNLGNAGKPKSGVKRSVAVQTPPDRDSVYREPADSFED